MTLDPNSRQRFEDARRKGLLLSIMDLMRHQRTEMLSFEDVRIRLNVRGQRSLGLQVVPIDCIIGSEGRYADFDRYFLPRSNILRDRWVRIDTAMRRLVPLPPVELYKIGDIYFVRDGNHRVSVARQLGQHDVDANVTELIIDVPLSPDLSLHDLMLKEEYSDFLVWTNLAELRPDQRIEFTEPGGYLDLVAHINTHRHFLHQERGADVDRDEAITSWYDLVYLPMVRAIRATGALRAFPERTEADLYRWIMDFRWYIRENTGTEPTPEEAARIYMQRFGKRGVLGWIEDITRIVLGRLSPDESASMPDRSPPPA